MLPAKAQAALQQALQHHNAGRVAQAAALYAELRKVQPTQFDAHHLGGVAALQSGKPLDAIPLLQRALQLRSNSAPTLMCLGLAQAQTGRPTEAETALRASVKLDKKNFEAWSNLAAVLSLLGRMEEAADAYRESLKLRPDNADAWTGLGCVLHIVGRSREAIQHLTQALQLNPRHPKAQLSRAQAWQGVHDVDRALADFDGHLARNPNDDEAASLRLCVLNYLADLPRERLFEAHQRFGIRFKATAQDRSGSSTVTTSAPSRRRIAFLSPDLRNHSVTQFLEPLLQYLDPEKFEIYLYHDHFNVDETSKRLAGRAAVWRNFVGQSHDAVEAQIRRDTIDVLFDLAGHTGMNRLPVFARRVAPVQISYLGYPNTTGLGAMDYRFTDATVDPLDDADHFATEKLVRFSSCAWAYQPNGDAPAVAPPPSLKNGSITFGSFNNFSKINALTLALWARLLREIPGSSLVLKSFGSSDSALRERLATSGLPMDKVTILPARDQTPEHLACYAEIDVALDPFPYHGTTTTCEALWMGVPVVTLRGDRHASRVGVSLLTAMGHPEWIAHNADEYVSVARNLVANPDVLAATRAQLRRDMQRSTLLDHAGQAARFGEAIRSLGLVNSRATAQIPAAVISAR